MLSRVADQLYWMARYSERAENMARILDVADRMTLIPQPAASQELAWRSALEVAGVGAGEVASGSGDAGRAVLHYLTFDDGNPMSIVSSLAAMRENARALRGSITTEMFEIINATWFELQAGDETVLLPDNRRRFFDWIKERSHLFRGVATGTMLQDEATWFMQAGFDIERADNTARLLDSKYHVLLPMSDGVGGALDYYQWGALLRSLSAFRAYHRIYRDRITAFRVAELVILNAALPRSLRACYDRLAATFEALGSPRPAETRRLAGLRHASLKFARMEQIFDDGLHEFLVDFIDGNAEVGQQFSREFMMTR